MTTMRTIMSVMILLGVVALLQAAPIAPRGWQAVAVSRRPVPPKPPVVVPAPKPTVAELIELYRLRAAGYEALAMHLHDAPVGQAYVRGQAQAYREAADLLEAVR